MKYLILAFFISGCECTDKNSPTSTSFGNGVYRVTDEQYNVVCYLYYTHGISCLKVAK